MYVWLASVRGQSAGRAVLTSLPPPARPPPPHRPRPAYPGHEARQRRASSMPKVLDGDARMRTRSASTTARGRGSPVASVVAAATGGGGGLLSTLAAGTTTPRKGSTATPGSVGGMTGMLAGAGAGVLGEPALPRKEGAAGGAGGGKDSGPAKILYATEAMAPAPSQTYHHLIVYGRDRVDLHSVPKKRLSSRWSRDAACNPEREEFRYREFLDPLVGRDRIVPIFGLDVYATACSYVEDELSRAA
jgi:hypothetical protein